MSEISIREDAFSSSIDSLNMNIQGLNPDLSIAEISTMANAAIKSRDMFSDLINILNEAKEVLIKDVSSINKAGEDIQEIDQNIAGDTNR